MAEGDPEISEDGLTYTFKIRDAQWSNGTPVTAHDFVYAWQRAIDPAYWFSLWTILDGWYDQKCN